MAPPKSFADDGAFGAGGGSSVGGVQMSDPGPGSSPSQVTTGGDGSSPWLAGMGPGDGVTMPPPGSTQHLTGPQPYSGMMNDSGGLMLSSPQFSGYGPSPAGLAFSQGGAIDDGSGDSDGSPQQDAIQKALSTVDGVLAFGRKLHGLGGGDDEGAIQTASNYPPGRMPAVPGSQSNSGVPPIQPMPGPLPPTSNPFGKRADAGDDGDQDDQPGAIDTDEDAA